VLYPMTVGAIKNDDEDVAMLAVEFWSTLCETEMNLDEGKPAFLEPTVPIPTHTYTNSEPFYLSLLLLLLLCCPPLFVHFREYLRVHEPLMSAKSYFISSLSYVGFEGYKYMEKAMPHLMPTLLATLERQNEDADDEDWNLASAASVCIQNIAQCCEDKVRMTRTSILFLLSHGFISVFVYVPYYEGLKCPLFVGFIRCFSSVFLPLFVSLHPLGDPRSTVLSSMKSPTHHLPFSFPLFSFAWSQMDRWWSTSSPMSRPRCPCRSGASGKPRSWRLAASLTVSHWGGGFWAWWSWFDSMRTLIRLS